MLERLIAILAISAIPSFAFAASWEMVSSDYNNEMYFMTFEIDASSVVKRDGLVRAWTRASFRPEKELSGSYPVKKYSSYMSLDYYDCEASETTTGQIIYYSKTFGEGENVYSMSNPKDTIKKSLEAIPPGTFAESIMKRVCAIASKQRK